MLQGSGQHSIASELAFQKQLAKQMGLKGRTKSTAKGPDDGLDDFLEGNAATSLEHADVFRLAFRPTLCLVTAWP